MQITQTSAREHRSQGADILPMDIIQLADCCKWQFGSLWLNDYTRWNSGVAENCFSTILRWRVSLRLWWTQRTWEQTSNGREILKDSYPSTVLKSSNIDFSVTRANSFTLKNSPFINNITPGYYSIFTLKVFWHFDSVKITLSLKYKYMYCCKKKKFSHYTLLFDSFISLF